MPPRAKPTKPTTVQKKKNTKENTKKNTKKNTKETSKKTSGTNRWMDHMLAYKEREGCSLKEAMVGARESYRGATCGYRSGQADVAVSDESFRLYSQTEKNSYLTLPGTTEVVFVDSGGSPPTSEETTFQKLFDRVRKSTQELTLTYSQANHEMPNQEDKWLLTNEKSEIIERVRANERSDRWTVQGGKFQDTKYIIYRVVKKMIRGQYSLSDVLYADGIIIERDKKLFVRDLRVYYDKYRDLTKFGPIPVPELKNTPYNSIENIQQVLSTFNNSHNTINATYFTFTCGENVNQKIFNSKHEYPDQFCPIDLATQASSTGNEPSSTPAKGEKQETQEKPKPKGRLLFGFLKK